MANFLKLLLIDKTCVNVHKDKKQCSPSLVEMAAKLSIQKSMSNLTHFFQIQMPLLNLELFSA